MKFPLVPVLDSYKTALDLIAYFPFHDEKKLHNLLGLLAGALGWLPFTVKVLKTMNENDRKLRKLKAFCKQASAG